MKKTSDFIGFIGLHVPIAELPFSPCVEIGWRLGFQFWGMGFATEAANEPIYEQLFDIARDNLRHIDVVIAGLFTKELKNPEWCERLTERLGVPVEIHYVSCAPEIRKERMGKRGNPRDEAKLRDWEEYLRYYDDETPPRCPHVLVDNSRDVVA